MKLWQKIFLCSLALVILAIDITSVLLLSNSHRLTVMREEQNAVSEHKYLSVMLKDNVIYERLKQNKVFLTEEEVIQVTQSAFEPQSSARTIGLSLYTGQRRLLSYNGRSEQLEVSILQSASQSSVLNQVQGLGGYALEIVDDGEASYLIVISQIILESQPYYLMTSSDVTEIYTLYKQQLNYVLVMSMICATVIASVLLIVVWLLLLPLRRINEGTRQIAQGNYSKRLPEKGSTEFSQLSRNMNEMAEAIEHNIKDLESVAEDRNTFIANLAHEMKTPLTSILGFGDLLRIKRTVDDKERREYAGIIVEETKRLKTLSGKLMELITVGSTQLDWQTIPLTSIMEEVGQALQISLSKSGITLNIKVCKIEVSVDKELFKSLIYNLIDNAIKASKSGQEIEVFAEETNGILTIAVKDHGIGIPKEEINKIMQPFYMIDKSRTRKAGGAGLGLALCSEIARLHGARLQIESEPRKGTCVSIIFDKKGETE